MSNPLLVVEVERDTFGNFRFVALVGIDTVSRVNQQFPASLHIGFQSSRIGFIELVELFCKSFFLLSSCTTQLLGDVRLT
jgi:hypothetical protein